MSNKMILSAISAAIFFIAPAVGETYEDAAVMEDIGAASVAEYDTTGTMFQRIADLEQEKVLMQLEKERTQLELDLDRLAAEKIKLQIEIDGISGRAEEQAQKLAAEKQKLENERAALDAQRAEPDTYRTSTSPAISDNQAQDSTGISGKYKLIEIIGAGSQLQATLEDLSNGQKKKVWVGRNIDGYEVKSISLDDGVVFSKDGKSLLLNIEVGDNRL